MRNQKKNKPKTMNAITILFVAVILVVFLIALPRAMKNTTEPENSAVSTPVSSEPISSSEVLEPDSSSEVEVAVSSAAVEESSSEPISSSKTEETSSSETQTTKPVTTYDDGVWNMILVNPDNSLPSNFDVELTEVQNSYRVDKRIKDAVNAMFSAAKADGVDLIICSAYRSVDKQTQLFKNKTNEYINAGKTEEEAIAVAATIVARPGTSEHHTGLALDIVTTSYQMLDDGFDQTKAYKWLYENCAEYGFILRYPKDKQSITKIIYEPWHYRYVGVDTAKEIMSQNICFEEYMANK